MKYYRKVTESVTAISFEQLVAIGLADPSANIVNGVPWSFFYGDTHVSHESDDCYLVGSERFERGDMLVTPNKPGAAPTAWGAAEFFGDYEAATLSDEVADREDAARYRRLQVLGCAVFGTKGLDDGNVSRFTNLDAIVDADIKAQPSRGENDQSSAAGRANH